ncbi:SusC/RagA family TonB-linked outer membrane protein [Mucilaginibacter sp. AW1-7]|uniref:SusC/RagA family TonB-linked outer membrane protein n=1 Tax=Mucilaginibacter sp. AW1-7 TaxID=3349874 RepID=UPI003F732E76
MRKFFLLFSVLLLLSSTLMAQTRTVTGKVVSSDKNEPLIGVSVQVKGSTAGTTTDTSGRYSIKVTNLQSVVIKVQYIGYAFQEKTLNVGEMNADFRMVPTSSNLDEVVIVGYGSQKRSHLTGAVETVDMTKIQDIPTTNLAAALRGTNAAVGVSGGTARPGQNASITIRNPIFLAKDGGSTDPLYIIDGAKRTLSDFNLLDQSEVENISILKDAAAAIYGIEGANGVIIVKTKRGHSGQPKISFSASAGSADAVQLPKMMSGLQLATWLNDYEQGLNGFNITPDGYIGGDLTKKDLNYYTPDELAYFADNNNNFLKQAFHPALVERGAVNVSGGNDKVTYFAGANYVNQNSNFSGVNTNRFGFRGSVDAKLAQGLKLSLSLSEDVSKSKSYWYKLSGTSESLDNDFLSLNQAPPWQQYFIDGHPVYLSSRTATDNINFFAVQNSNNYTSSNNYIMNALANLSYDIPGVKGLSANVSYNRNINNNFSKQYGTSFVYYQYSGTGSNNHIPGGTIVGTPTIKNGDRVRLTPSITDNYQFNASLNYNRIFGKHEISFIALYEQYETSFEGVNAEADGVILNGKDNQNFTTGAQSSNQASSISEGGKQAYAARLNYGYADKYLVELSLRADANTNFPPGNQWGYFPSGSVGWVVSKEDFFKNVSFVDFFKLRASVGSLGSYNTKAYQYAVNYKIGTGSGGGAVFGGNNADKGIGLTTNIAIANPDYTWDHDTKTNYGIDLRFLNNRLSATADYFWDHHYNMLASLNSSVPVTVGATPSTENYGSINTFGYEVSVSWKDHIGKNWTYNVSPFFTWSDNKYLKYDLSSGLAGTFQDLTNKSGDQGTLGYKSLGIIRTQADADAIIAERATAAGGAGNVTIMSQAVKPGMLNFQDLNGDGIIDSKDLQFLGHKSNNHYSMGFNFGGSYKSLSLNVIMGLSWGGTASIEGAATKQATASENRPVFWADHWTPTNTEAKYPAPYYYQTYAVTTDFWFVSPVTWNISSANLSYALPDNISKKLGMASVRAYVVATNPVSFLNPYPNSYRSQSTPFTSYPNLRTISFGLNLGF